MILFHADDYGINRMQAERILACSKQGVLNSVSIMPNSVHLDETISLLQDEIKKGVHLNLAEGHTCADPDKVPLLHKNGIMRHSFFSLLFISIIRYKALKEQAATEILAQINTIMRYLPADYKIRIDSHIHYHMIPGVFNGMCKALSLCGHEVEYIRFPSEVLRIYTKSPSVWRHIHPVNIIKMLLLNFFGVINRKLLKKYGYETCTGYFFGVAFTSEMYGAHVLEILRKYCKLSEENGKCLEILFHPGAIYEGEEYLAGCNDAFKAVYSSNNRKREAEMLHRME